MAVHVLGRELQKFGDRRRQERRAEAFEAWHDIGRGTDRRQRRSKIIENAKIDYWLARFWGIREATRLPVVERENWRNFEEMKITEIS